MEEPKVELVQSEWLDERGYLNDQGKDVLVALLKNLEPGNWGKAFIPLRSLVVSVSIELVIVQNGKVLLTYRDDACFNGWHTPGSHINPRETFQAAAQRCASRELGEVKVRVVRDIGCVNHSESKRFHGCSVLVLCELVEGKPNRGEWFNECPSDLIPDHLEFWPKIIPYLI